MYTLNQLYHITSFLMYTYTTYQGLLMKLPMSLSKIPISNFDPGALRFLTIWNLMRDGLLIGFHVISCVQFAFSVYYDYMYTVVPPNVLKVHNGYGGKFKFLTFWDAIIQAVFFFICILNDWFGTNAVSPKKPPFVRKLKDHMHSILGFPVAMFVGIIFWALMFVDRELVLPKALDPYFPWWLNHLMHTSIMVSTFIEMMVHIIFYKSGIWVYPVLEVLSLPLRTVFFSVLISIALILYMIGEAVDNFFWGNEYTKSKNSYAKSK
ncbi:hypothetical protein E2986_06515 [Frieseomelitta varia]|uniref:Uncharacterized protein n=1 Tax=Frieseomelitta varia TaxID=561572 RepID=A0A833VXH7_9HYME|nr:hypothetical protein E2986_06515 [Frieseomelitta varia]